jgi:eukaryotic-like serine/threonine-protein kinase
MSHSPSLPPPGAARLVGPYELGPKIGRGGMANIYVAKDSRDASNNPIVALKVIREELALKDPYYLDLFADEARTLEHLKHDNLIRVFEIGLSTSHRYIAMELLLGRSLADVFDLLAARGERFPVELAILICSEVANGLHHAHELCDEHNVSLELVHRDVNPSNIFLTFDGRVKVIDFGLARSRGAQAKTLTGVANGKVTYLAPEQIGGKTADRRIDIFQLGITLWELLAGERLFLRETPAESLRAIQAGEFPDIGRKVPSLPVDVQDVVRRALRADPDKRYTTMHAMSRALAPLKSDRSLGEYLESIFPGQRAELEAWFREVTQKRPRADSTLFPPAPVPSSDALARADMPQPSGTMIDTDENPVIITEKPNEPITIVNAPAIAAPTVPPYVYGLAAAGLAVGLGIGWLLFAR